MTPGVNEREPSEGTPGFQASSQSNTLPTSEASSYTLTLGGRYAGTQDWVIRPDKGSVVARVQTEFGGALPAGRRVQESRMAPQTGFSMAYAEAEDGNRRPQFETIFDERSGLVTLRQGKDEASQPLLEGHHDPLSLLLWLRRRQGGPAVRQQTGNQEQVSEPGSQHERHAGEQQVDEHEHAAHEHHKLITLRMVGGRVHLQPLPDSQVQGLAAWVYFLRPGGAYVYVERAAPHRLLRLIQPSDFGPVEALLTLEHPGITRDHSRQMNRHEHARPVRGQVGKPRRRR